MELKSNFVRSVCLGVTALFVLGSVELEKSARAQQAKTEQNAQANDADDKSSQYGGDELAKDEPTIPGLEEMLKIALEHNPDVRAAKAQLAVYQAELDRTRLEVVRQLTAFREKWQGRKAALQAALEEENNIREFAAREISQQTRLAAHAQVHIARAKLREIEAELPFLLGRPDADAGSEQTGNAPLSRGRQLLKEKIRPLAERGVELSLKSFRVGEADLEPAFNWVQRLLDVELALADDKAARIAALEEQRSWLEDLNSITNATYRTGNALQQDVLAAQYHLLQVELMLLKEKADEE